MLTLAQTESHGLEAEAVWRPGHGPLDIGMNATLAKSTFTHFGQSETDVDAFGTSVTTQTSFSGKNIPHIPRVMVEVTPGYNFNVADQDGRVFLTWRYSGARYLDNANGFKLPGYEELGLGANYEVTDAFHLQLNVQNVLNSVGMTEGGCSLCGTTVSSNILGASANVFSGRPWLPRSYLLTATYKF